MDIKISGGYYRKSEPEETNVRMEYGMGAHIILRFYDPMIISIDGEEIITEKNSFIIYTSGTPQYYRAVAGGFTNDYVCFFADHSYFKKYSLPLNEIFYSENYQKADECIGFITWMLTDVMVDHTSELKEQLDLMLSSLQDNLMLVSAKSKRQHLIRRQYISLREQVMQNPAEWTVEKMAKKIFMTRSHFCITYKEQFGVAPSEDLLSFTMELAKKLLNETQLTVSEISEKCGYVNPNNFTRAFKKFNGITPLKYKGRNKKALKES